MVHINLINHFVLVVQNLTLYVSSHILCSAISTINLEEMCKDCYAGYRIRF